MDDAVTVPDIETDRERLLYTMLAAALGIDALSLGMLGIGSRELAGPRSMLLGVGALGLGLGLVCAGVAVRLYGEPLALVALVWVVATAVGATGVAMLTETGPAILERAFLSAVGLAVGLVAVLSVGALFHVVFEKIDL